MTAAAPYRPLIAMKLTMPSNRVNGVLLWLLNLLGSAWAKLAGLTDWSLFGWAFAGATAFVVWEMCQTPPVQRTGRQRIYMVLLGLVVSLALNNTISKKFDFEIQGVTFVLGVAGYAIIGLVKKRVDKAGDEGIDDAVRDKLLNDKTPPGTNENE